ncbi:MAG: 4Fe-4S binding protein [Erysipelotrichaceae bacterium]|nr:4Fe-4S binding protein [Erysipelotrichaceae bacterium]
MNRQGMRKTSILISLILFPVTLYYFSPYLVIEALTQQVIAGSFIIFTLMLLGSIFFGRLFCGWLCPAGGLQEASTIINDRRVTLKKAKLIKYLIWLPWISLILILLLLAKDNLTIDFFYQTWYGISISDPYGFIIYFGVVFLILILALILGRRGFCHTVCWMAPFMQLGMWIQKKMNIPHLYLQTRADECIHCNACTKKCSMSLSVMELVQEGKINDLDCILCLECVDVCPKKIIKLNIK